VLPHTRQIAIAPTIPLIK